MRQDSFDGVEGLDLKSIYHSSKLSNEQLSPSYLSSRNSKARIERILPILNLNSSVQLQNQWQPQPLPALINVAQRRSSDICGLPAAH